MLLLQSFCPNLRSSRCHPCRWRCVRGPATSNHSHSIHLPRCSLSLPFMLTNGRCPSSSLSISLSLLPLFPSLSRAKLAVAGLLLRAPAGQSCCRWPATAGTLAGPSPATSLGYQPKPPAGPWPPRRLPLLSQCKGRRRTRIVIETFLGFPM